MTGTPSLVLCPRQLILIVRRIMKIIRKCSDCGYYRVSSPTNYIFEGNPLCGKKSSRITDEKIPDWCPLEDAPNQAMYSDGKKQCICGDMSYSKYCPIHGYVG